MSEKLTRETAFRTAYLNGKNILFTADGSHGIRDIIGDIREGSVVGVSEKERSALVCFLVGHRSLTDPVSFDNFIAVADKANGKQATFGRFSGPYVDLKKLS